MILTGQTDQIWQDSAIAGTVIDDWKIQVAFILKNIDFIPHATNLVKKFFVELADQILVKKQNLWAHIYLKALSGSFKLDSLVVKSEMNTQNIDL